MPKSITHNRLLQFLLWLVLASVLSGCFKVRMTIDVQPNGSGNLGIALGMTDQAKTLVASQWGDPMQTLSKNLGVSSGNSPDVKVTRWTDGDYEWVQGEVAYKDLNELNNKMSQTDLFDSFSVTRQPGIFRDRFILNASLKPFMEDTNTTNTSNFGNIDPSAFIEFQIAVHLPGSIIETNGILDGQNSSTMLWTVNSKQSITMQATTEAWNWFNIGIAGGSVGLAILVIGGFVLLVITSRSKPRRGFSAQTTAYRMPPSNGNISDPKKLPQIHTQPEAILPVQPSPSISPTFPNDMLITIGARSLLHNVNRFLLKDIGLVSEAPNELNLQWPCVPGSGEMQGIHIKLISQQQVTINGQAFPANHEGVKKRDYRLFAGDQ
jgi:hypothetical protein